MSTGRRQPFFPPPTFDDVPENKDKLRVVRPDPNTGEHTEAVVSEEVLRPPRKGKPRLREGRVSPCWGGWSTIHVIDYRLRLIAFWENHAASLTREEERDLAAHRTKAVLRPREIPPTWRTGDVLQVANNVEAVVQSTEVTARGHRTVFKVFDFRPWLMKQTVGGSRLGPSREHPSAIEKARVDGNYTRSPAQAVPGTDDVIDDTLHQQLHGDASAAGAVGRSRRRSRLSRSQLEERLRDAEAKHQTATVKVLKRKLGRR